MTNECLMWPAISRRWRTVQLYLSQGNSLQSVPISRRREGVPHEQAFHCYGCMCLLESLLGLHKPCLLSGNFLGHLSGLRCDGSDGVPGGRPHFLPGGFPEKNYSLSFLRGNYKITQRWAKVLLKALVERSSVVV